jgi:hypothetical protein
MSVSGTDVLWAGSSPGEVLTADLEAMPSKKRLLQLAETGY